MTFTHALTTNNYGPAKFIVASSAANGTHTSIATALTSASSGDTIFIRPGTYTENITLKAGVNLAAYDADASTPNVTILGTCSFALAGTVSLSGINLKTNSANCLSITGSAATIVNLINCNIDVNNNTAISFTTSNTAAAINLYYCTGTIDTTGIAIYSMSSTGNLAFRWCVFGNAGASLTASSNSAGAVLLSHSVFNSIFSTSSTGQIVVLYTAIDCSSINSIVLTTAGTGSANAINFSALISGSASTLSIGSGTTIQIAGARLDSSNTNVITGAGTTLVSSITYTGTSNKSNVTTQTGGAVGGITQGTAPSAGYVGEQIRATVGAGSPVTITTNNTPVNVTSINLTAGIWDVSGVVNFGGTSVVGTGSAISVNTTTATQGTAGDNRVDFPFVSSATTALSLTVPSWRVTASTTTTCYLVAQVTFSGGSPNCYGRISATRVG